MVRLLVMADGRSVHTDRWCRYFAEHGFDVALFSLEPAMGSAYRIYQGHRPTGIATIDYRLARRNMRAAIADFHPDVISAHYVVSYGWLASYCTSCPVVVTAWGSDLLLAADRSIMHRRRVSRALTRASYCTVDSENLEKIAAEYMDSDKIVRVLFGIERHAFDEMAKSSFPDGGPLRIIAPRGLQPVYDPNTILDAAALLRGRFDIRIDLSGEGDRIDEFNRKIESYLLSDMVRVRARIPKHADYLASLPEYDMYVSASLSDSTSAALLEAMSAGLFPVVTKIDGNREWITHGRNGLLFVPGSASSLADAIVRAASMRNRFAAVAEENRRIIESLAIWEDNMERAKNLFMELTGK